MRRNLVAEKGNLEGIYSRFWIRLGVQREWRSGLAMCVPGCDLGQRQVRIAPDQRGRRAHFGRALGLKMETLAPVRRY